MPKCEDLHATWVKLLVATGKKIVSLEDIREIMVKHDLKKPQWFTKDSSVRAGHGLYHVPFAIRGVENPMPPKVSKKSTPVDTTTVELNKSLESLTQPTKVRIGEMITDLEEKCSVPEKYKNFVPFGPFDDIKAIITSKQFYPVFITGDSGKGKTMGVEQACALLGREYIPFSMTPETDEGDLLGNYVMIKNEMVWRDGPVTIAARRGAVLCLDELDYGAQNLSPLQRVLEGKPFLLKKKGEIVTPKEGFQIFATANTKGKGSEDGRYMYTNILNESLLERFPITIEQPWAPAAVERRIVKKELEASGRSDDSFAELLVQWASIVRKSYEQDGLIQEVISTRRLVHIARAFPIFSGDRMKAITYCLNRFDNTTKSAMIDLYTKCDPSVKADVNDPSLVASYGAPTISSGVS